MTRDPKHSVQLFSVWKQREASLHSPLARSGTQKEPSEDLPSETVPVLGPERRSKRFAASSHYEWRVKDFFEGGIEGLVELPVARGADSKVPFLSEREVK